MDASIWEIGRIQVEQFENYKLIVKASRGEEGDGYVGIDDFKFEMDAKHCETFPAEAAVTPTSAPTTQPTSATPSETFPDCDFNENECGWAVDDTQDLVWMRTRVQDLQEMGYDAPKENVY